MIELDNIAKRYNTSLILQQVSCIIPTGSTTLIIGNNGAGKSTLLRIIAGLESSTHGRIAMQEECIAYIGHTSAMYPRLTAIENLLFWQRLYGYKTTQEQCITALHEVNLYQARNKEVRYFSKGMLQRLHISLLLLQNPTLILLDEPCTGLDIHSTTLFYSILQKKQEQGVTILWITHSLDSDICYASHVLLLDKKTLVFYGSTDEYTHYTAYSCSQ